jgi:uncharacterized protein
MESLSIQELLRPDAFPHEVGQLTLRETHISWVILTGPFAYKIKKPIKLDFIDASTLQQRRHYCSEELRLNRRLALDLYVDVVAITRSNDRIVVAGDGPAIEYAVRMRQFAASDELPELLANRGVDVTALTALGELLAHFHLHAAVARPEDAHQWMEQSQRSVLDNLAQLAARIGRLEPSADLGRLADWTRETMEGLEPIFQNRERRGFIRESHGDLHAANIVRVRGQLLPFDCIEFDPQLRWIDVVNDVAFLVMDLVAWERADLAFAMLSRYLEVTGDYDGMRVLPFYAAYRALVRAKVDATSAEAVPAQADEFCDHLQRRIRAANHWIEQRPTAIVIMHGPSGSGKSWLSERLIPELRAIRVRSDLERKRLAGTAVTDSAAADVHQGIYAPQFSHHTYRRLAECTEACCLAGLNVVVDAAFLESDDRKRFSALAQRLGAAYVIVSCQAGRATLQRRILQRDAAKRDASDATIAVLDAQLSQMLPFEHSEQQHVVSFEANEPDAFQRLVGKIGRLMRVTQWEH